MRLDSSRIGSQLTRLWWGGQQQQFSRVGGWQALACLNPAMHKASDAGHIGPHGMRRCLSFSYRETRPCRRPPPPSKKPAHFWGVLDVHKTSQIPSKMALGRGRFGARGGSPKTLTTSRKLIFFWFFDVFWFGVFFGKNLGTCKKHRKYRQKLRLRTRLEFQKLPCFWLSKNLKI